MRVIDRHQRLARFVQALHAAGHRQKVGTGRDGLGERHADRPHHRQHAEQVGDVVLADQRGAQLVALAAFGDDEAQAVVGIADVMDYSTSELGNIDISGGGNFTRHHADSSGHQDFASHTARGIFLQDRVKDGVRNLIRHLVRVTLGH